SAVCGCHPNPQNPPLFGITPETTVFIFRAPSSVFILQPTLHIPHVSGGREDRHAKLSFPRFNDFSPPPQVRRTSPESVSLPTLPHHFQRDGNALHAQAPRPPHHHAHRQRPHRHRPGLRVRLFRHPGLQGPPRGRLPRRARELEPGHHHDRPGHGRCNLRGALDLGDLRKDYREG